MPAAKQSRIFQNSHNSAMTLWVMTLCKVSFTWWVYVKSVEVSIPTAAKSFKLALGDIDEFPLLLGRGPLQSGVLQQLMHTDPTFPGEQNDW